MNNPKQARLRALREARACLNRADNRSRLIMCLLMCLLATVSLLLAAVSLVYAIALAVPGFENSPAAAILVGPVVDVACFFLVWPLYLGTLRFALALGRGEPAGSVQMFDFYRSGAELRRGWGICLHLIIPALPFVAVRWLPYLLLALGLGEDPFASVLVLILWPVGAVSAFFLTSRIFPAVMLALDNEKMPLATCFRRGVQMTEGKRNRILAVRLSLVWRMLLSLLSIGVVTLLHVLPLAILSYGGYSETLIKEWEADHAGDPDSTNLPKG